MEIDEKLLNRLLPLIESHLRIVDLRIESTISPVVYNGEPVQRLVRENSNRTEIWIHNDAPTQTLHLAMSYSEDISQDRFTIKLDPDETAILSANSYSPVYQGDVYAFWSTPNEACRAMITEFFRKK